MKFKGQSGQILVGVAAALIVLLGFGGLAMDMGVMRHQRRLLQTAADAAAIAGANDIRNSAGVGITGAATDAVKRNGFDPTSPSVTVTVNSEVSGGCSGPCSGPHTGDVNYVEAIVSFVQPTFFMSIFGVRSETISARAVATEIGLSGTAPGCVFTLGSPGSAGIGGIVGSGNPSLQAPTCGIEDNGDFTTNGSKTDINAGNIGVAGDTTNHNSTVTCVYSTTCPVQIPPVTDPLSFLQPPTVATPVAWNGTPVPGTTYGSISINGGATVNFPAGTYIVDGSFTINSGATVCNQVAAGCSANGALNAGVTFYITNGGTVKTNGNANIYLSAPNSGPYAGVLFFQDRNDTSKALMDGTANSFYQGALYFPGAELDFGGNLTNTTAAYTVIVAQDLKLNGGPVVTLQSNYSSLPGQVSIIENAVLVE